MTRTALLARRDLLRYAMQPSTWLLGAAFYLVQAVFFCLLLESLRRPQPQTVPPESVLFSGGYLLFLYCVFLPALAMRAFAEERASGTWDGLSAMGIGLWRLALAKYASCLLLFWAWQVLAFLPALLLLGAGSADLPVLAASFAGLLLLAALWLAVAMLAACRVRSVLPAYLAAFLALFVLWFFPYLRAALPDPLYRPLFEALNFDAVLGRTSRGRLELADVALLAGGTALLLLWLRHVLELERDPAAGWQAWLRALWPPPLLALVLYLGVYVANHLSLAWDASLLGRCRPSPEFRRIMERLPADSSITVVLPREAGVGCYGEARDMILAAARQAAAAGTGVAFRQLDPDLDLLEIERLRERETMPANVIGGLVLAVGERSVAVPYHQLVTLSYANVEGSPVPYIHTFHGEEQMAAAFQSLRRRGRLKALAIQGQGEVDLGSTDREGGSDCALMLRQMGVDVRIIRPDFDAPPADRPDLALWLDPRQPPTGRTRELVADLFAKRVPMLAAVSPIPSDRAWPGRDALFAPWGLSLPGRVVLQRAFRSVADPFTLPLQDLSLHPITSVLQGTTLLFHYASPVAEGVPADPRLVPEPLVRTATHERIWAGKNDPGSLLRQVDGPAAGDTPSPLVVAWAVKLQEKEGSRPQLVLLGSRAPVENRLIHEGANRQFVYRAADWLLRGDGGLLLPPRRPADYRLDLPASRVLLVEAVSLLAVPLLLVLGALLVRLRRR